MNIWRWFLVLLPIACASEEGGTRARSSGADAGTGPETQANGSNRDAEAPEPMEYGRLGEPETSFTLPVPEVSDEQLPALAYPDLPGSFPEVDWTTLDRLYLPAGHYHNVRLGGLPERSAERPLVITNQGGQVRIGGTAPNYLFNLSGGRHWVLTGRYDPISMTGDAAFRGHAEGDFANSQGTYGIWVDDGFSRAGLSGIAIGGGASDFELDTIEVSRAEFAGITIKTDDDGQATMRNVRLHDLYVHDTGSEGLYLGSTQAQPQHSFEHLAIYDNRFLRTGTEALQVGQLGSECEIHHNVLGPAAIRWRSAFQRYQDGNVQYGQRYGSSSFHHNIVIGTGDLFVELFPTVVEGDPRAPGDTVVFEDNYFSDSSAGGVYTHADETGVTIRFERNSFRGFVFNYDEVYPDASEPNQVFAVGSNSPNPHQLLNNVTDSSFPFIQWVFDSVTEESNVQQVVARVRFRDFMGAQLDGNYRQLEWWTDMATLSPDQRAVVYPEGAFVMHQGTLYRALEQNEQAPPDENPDVWQALVAPADDVRLARDSAYPELGIRWPGGTSRVSAP